MKRIGKIFFSILITFIIIIGIGFYFVISKQKDKDDINDKVLSELDYVEETFLNFFNEMNNIEYENYKLSIQNVNNDEVNKEGQSNTSSEGSNLKSENSEEKDQSSSSTQNTDGEAKSGTTSTDSTKSDNEKYVLESTGVLTKSDNIDWQKIKIQIENLYVSLPTITLDLYKVYEHKEDILNFNTEIDNLVGIIKKESKEETLSQLLKIYEYMPKFISKITDDENRKIEYNTKYQVLKAYSKIDTGDWNLINSDLDTAIQSFSDVITKINNENIQYKYNKIYVMLQEIKKASEKQDIEIFLIKYKNLVEDLNNL